MMVNLPHDTTSTAEKHKNGFLLKSIPFTFLKQQHLFSHKYSPPIKYLLTNPYSVYSDCTFSNYFP